MSINFAVSATITSNIVGARLKKIKEKLAKLPQEAFNEFVHNTPVATGNARRKTRLRGKTIHADYQYAGVLDKGRHMTNKGLRGSEQAPEGMSKPTTEFIRKRVKQIVRGT